ncbi:TetR/AcrR family transcriptional regulator [Actinopolymorpha pittospori]|uniref:AcrR family transcriptional regulator n=1 Tax=Actinopolymorpha pittospori TaxID=648752 RepID=A0A927R6Y7_9ACTN|nr:TetR/AcrR family transcriptional regulator [Actinopolymorpha pittospori]MBE1604952.1 AcrR family transcriptional regulator [Actinopolymorpha pittospori]
MAADTPAMAVLWGRTSTPRRGPKPTLSVETIAQAGIRVADADGLAAVTMQRVAQELGVTKMALYRYVPGKVEMVALMTDVAIGAPPADRAGRQAGGPAWRPRLETWATRMYERFSAHPWALEATVGARPIGPNEVAWLEEVAAALADTPLSGAETLDTAAALSGQVRMVAQQAAAYGADSPEQSLLATLGAVLAEDEDRFPAVAAALADTAGATDQALDFGIQRLLDGVELLISRR